MSYLNKDSKVPKVPMYDWDEEGYDMRLLRDDSQHYQGRRLYIYEEEKYRGVPMRSSVPHRHIPVVSLIGRQYAPVPEDYRQRNPRRHNTNSGKQQSAMASPDKSSCILPRADWERIQSLLNQPKAKKYTRQEMLDSNAGSLFSKAQNNIMKSRIGELQAARNLRLQTDKEHWKKLAAEEVEFKKQEEREALEETNTKRFHQNGSVRRFDSTILRTKLQTENELLVELKREKQRFAEERERRHVVEMRRREEEAVKREQKKASQKQLDIQSVANYCTEQMKEKQQLREEERQREKEERDRLRAVAASHAQELRHEKEKKVESRKSNLQFRQREISSRVLDRVKEAQKVITEEAKRQRVQVDMEEKLQQRKIDQAEKFKKLQVPKEIANGKLAVSKKKQTATWAHQEAEKLSKATAEQDAKVAKRQRDKEETRAAMLKSISAHRDKKVQEKERYEKEEQQSKLDWLQAKKASDRLFLEQKKLTAKRNIDNKIICRDTNATITAQKHARLEQLKRQDRDAAQKQAEQIAEKDKQLGQYVQRELHKAAGKDVQQLLAASTGRRGVISERGEPSYCSAKTDDPLPRFATDQTRFVKRYLERNSLQLGMDTKPVHLPPISRAAPLKSNNASAAEEVTVRRSPTAGSEASRYLPKDPCGTLPRLSTAQNRSTKPYLERDRLQLTNKEAGMVDLQQTCFPPVSTKETPAEKHGLPRAEEGFQYRSETGESLPMDATEQTRYIKQRQERNKLLPRRP